MHTTQYVIYLCILAMVILFFYDVARSFIHASLQLFFKRPSIIQPNTPAIFFKKSPGVIEIQVGVGICFLLHTYLQFVTRHVVLVLLLQQILQKSFIFMYFDKIFPSACKYITRSKYSSLHEYTRSHSCFLARVSISKMFVKLFYIESLVRCNKRLPE